MHYDIERNIDEMTKIFIKLKVSNIKSFTESRNAEYLFGLQFITRFL